MKIAILGGSFDPVHYGHIQMAVHAKEQCGVDEVWFMPTYKTPLKDRGLTDTKHRLEMLELAVQDFPYCKVCRYETDRQEKSYTIDTLKALKKMYPHDSFYWIIGNDQLLQFSDWKGADELVKLAQFVCFDRDGDLTSTSYDIWRLHMPMMPVSSSEIRQGNKLNYVPMRVLEYIYANRLYIQNFVASRVGQHRFEHSVSVANLCEEIAIANQLDGQKAYLIGLFHDIAKAMRVDEMEPWMDIVCPENKTYAPAVWHGFVGSEIVDRIFYLKDEQVKNAIYHHVLGTSTDPYAMIVFCADKTDPLRGYDSSAMIQACKENIESGFRWIQEENKKYLERG